MRLIHRRRFPVDHFVLVDESRMLSPERLLARARRYAGVLAAMSTGNAQCFTLIHNGAGIARYEDPHVHIICAQSRIQKGLIYLFIGLKNLVPVFLHLMPQRRRGVTAHQSEFT